MADYLEAYAARFELAGPHRRRRRRPRAERRAATSSRAGTRRFEADNVVVATGVMPAGTRVRPGVRRASSTPPSGSSTPTDYRSPDAAAGRRGARRRRRALGGRHRVRGREGRLRDDAVGAGQGQLPFDLEGRAVRLARPVLRLMATRVLTVSTPLGRKMKPEIRSTEDRSCASSAPTSRRPVSSSCSTRTVGTRDGKPVLADGRALDVANVVWCTGFRHRLRLDSLRRSPSRTTAIPCRFAAPFRAHPGSTSRACRSCTRSARCSSSAQGVTARASRSTSRSGRGRVRERATARARRRRRSSPPEGRRLRARARAHSLRSCRPCVAQRSRRSSPRPS